MIVQAELETKLRAAFAPSHIAGINESHMHAVPPDSETQFQAVVVSEAVRLAQTYSTEKSAAFVNGVLATLAKSIRDG